jgi:uncharacterized protein (DUF427 family)
VLNGSRSPALSEVERDVRSRTIARASAQGSLSTALRKETRARGSVRVERGTKRVRAYLGGRLVADTTAPLLVWEKPYYPTYYFPADDVRSEILEADGGVAHSPSGGDGRTFTVRAGGKEARRAAQRYEQSPFEELRDAIRLEWDAMDAWFEEDEQVFTHPRDPYTRVDTLPSSRQARIEVGGSQSRTSRPSSSRPAYRCATTSRRRKSAWTCSHRLIPRATARTRVRPSGGRFAWAPRFTPTWRGPTDAAAQSQKIAGLVGFYDEKVDLYVEGVLQDRPRTKFA